MSKTEAQLYNEQLIEEFRANDGHVSSFGDSPLMLLTTTGAKSGQPRTSPVMYLADDKAKDRVYVFASAAGSDKHPAWFHNLSANPNGLTVEIGDRKLTADAEIGPEPRRGEVYAVQAERFPAFAGYQEQTARAIPVVALTLHDAPRG